MIAYTIEAALRRDFFENVFLSTDLQEYAYIAMCYGADAHFLRSEQMLPITTADTTGILSRKQSYRLKTSMLSDSDCDIFSNRCYAYAVYPWENKKSFEILNWLTDMVNRTARTLQKNWNRLHRW